MSEFLQALGLRRCLEELPGEDLNAGVADDACES
jgi:hypothetical protein